MPSDYSSPIQKTAPAKCVPNATPLAPGGRREAVASATLRSMSRHQPGIFAEDSSHHIFLGYSRPVSGSYFYAPPPETLRVCLDG